MVHNLEVVDGLGGKLSAAAPGVLVVIAYTVDADCVAAWPQSSKPKAPLDWASVRAENEGLAGMACGERATKLR